MAKKASVSISYPQDFLIVGVDPGMSGGVAYYHRSIGWNYEAMPPTDLELRELSDLIESKATEIGVEPRASIELVHAMPGQGVVSMFKFGKIYGSICQAFCRMSAEFVHPKTWMKGLQIPPREKSESKPQYKERLRQKAIRLFPKLPVWKEKLGTQRCVCDALLIAEYGKRKAQGLL